VTSRTLPSRRDSTIQATGWWNPAHTWVFVQAWPSLVFPPLPTRLNFWAERTGLQRFPTAHGYDGQNYLLYWFPALTTGWKLNYNGQPLYAYNALGGHLLEFHDVPIPWNT
jgi:hypothetical protein